MKKKVSHLFTFLAIGLAMLSLPAGATTLNTVPEGLLSLDIPATSGVSVFFSLPLTADPVYTGAVAASGVTATTITVADATPPFANLTTGVQLANLAAAGHPYFVKFLSGAETGRVLRIASNTSSALTLDTTDNTSQTTSLLTSGFAVAAGDTFEVFPGTTLATVFGDGSAQDPVAIAPYTGVSVLAADTVGIPDSTGHINAYFYNQPNSRWEAFGNSQNLNNTIIYPYSALSITRRSNTNALSIVPMAKVSTVLTSGAAATDQLVPMSRVAEVGIRTKTTGSSHVVFGSTSYPVDMTLSQVTFSTGAVWATYQPTNPVAPQVASPLLADTVSVWNTTSHRFDTFYQNADHTWTQFGVTGDKSAFLIPAGRAIQILHRSAINGANSFLPSTMPYSL